MRLIAPIVAAMVALGVLAAPAFALTPTLFCSVTAAGTVGTYNLPTDCGGGTLLAGGYHSIYVTGALRCDSTTFKETSLILRFQGDSGMDYDYSYNSAISGIANAHNQTSILIADVSCNVSGTNRANGTGSFAFTVPMADSTVYDKNVFGQAAFEVDTSPAWSSIAQYGGSWHRASPGAITRLDLSTSPAANLLGRIDVYVE